MGKKTHTEKEIKFKLNISSSYIKKNIFTMEYGFKVICSKNLCVKICVYMGTLVNWY